ncbi:NB-ARC domain-containing protein [Micromonospora echinaurantiaca]|uniref:NB-ARC domain-containing protein n=1 Tax=Micromonospora echinaurantiaca TaxID=47857 RepID=UPI00378D9A3E
MTTAGDIYEARDGSGQYNAPGGSVVVHHYYANPPATGVRYVGWEVPGLGGRRPVDRPDLTAKLVSYLTDGSANAVGVTTALHGAGGFGKTTLATYVCSGKLLRESFPGGLLWVTVGQDKSGAELLTLVNDLCIRLGGGALGTLEQAGSRLGNLLDQYPPILLVLDDVWEEAALGPFMIGGERCTRLITTRIPTVIPDGAQFVRVDQMEQAESVAVLTAGLAGMPSRERRRLLELTGRWPLLLGLVNAQLRHAVQRGDNLASAAAEAVRRLSEHGPAILDVTRSSARSRAVDATMRASMDLLGAGSRARYQELAIFAEDVDIPFDVISTLWRATAGYDERAVVRAIEDMVDLSLFAAYRFTDRAVRLHDVLRQYLRHLCGDDNIRALNTVFLGSNRSELCLPEAGGHVPWWALPDDRDYLWQHLAYHLAESEHAGQLETLLTDLRWLVEKSRRYDVAAVEADLTRLDTPLAAGLKAALGRDAHVLQPITKDKSYPAVIISRLTGAPELSDIINRYRAAIGPQIASIENYWPLPDQSAALVRVITDGQTQITASRLSPDSRYIATVGAGPDVMIWSRDTGQRLYTLSGHIDAVTACVFSADQLTLYSTSSDKTVRVWDLLSRRQRRVLTGHAAKVNGCALSPDGSKLLSVGDDRTARIWDTNTGTELVTFDRHSDRVLSGVFSPDGHWVLTTSADGQCRRWATATGREIEAWTAHLGMTTSCAIAPDGSWFVTGGEDEMVRVWNLSTPRVADEMPGHRGRVTAVAISPSGAAIASCGDDRSIRIWDASRRATGAVLYGHSWYVTDCVFSADGRWLLSAGWDKSARLWDTSLQATDRPEPAARARTTSCASTPAGDLLLTGARDGELQLWSVEQGTHRTLGRGAAIVTADLSPEGTHAVVADSAGRLTVREVATGAEYVLVPQVESRIERCRFSADGRQIAAGAQDGTVTVWAWPERTVTRVISGHENWVADCAFSPDGLWLVSVSWDSTVLVGRIAEQVEPFKLSGHHRGPIHCCAITPSGDQLVTGGADGQLNVWTLPNGVLTTRVRAHEGDIRACAISHDGRYLLTGGDDASVRVWTWDDFTNIASMRVAGPIADVAWCGPARKFSVVGDVGVHVFRLAQHPGIPHARRPPRQIAQESRP